MLYHKWGWEAALSGVGRWKGMGKHGLISPAFLNCFQLFLLGFKVAVSWMRIVLWGTNGD